MRVFVGRQPILDRNLRTYGYELLFRSGSANRFDGSDAVESTAAVIITTFLSIGADRILGKARGFINFPRDLLIGEAVTALPPETVVIEVLETVEPDADVIQACRRLKACGFLLALDDFVRQPGYEPLVDLADFIKVDFRVSDAGKRRAMAEEYTRRGIRLVAEKVENEAEFKEARALGCAYFQGYFFAKPQIVSAQAVPGSKLNYLRILRELHTPDLDLARVEGLVRLELSLVHQLMRFVNSAVFPRNRRIQSIRHALVTIGENDLRKWVSLAALPGLVAGKPLELIRTSLTRARLCELLAEHSWRAHAADGFLVGLFSLLDAMIGRPLPELVGELGLSEGVAAALTGTGTPEDCLVRALDLCRACEAASEPAIEEHSAALGLSFDTVAQLSVEAMSWSESACHESEVSR